MNPFASRAENFAAMTCLALAAFFAPTGRCAATGSTPSPGAPASAAPATMPTTAASARATALIEAAKQAMGGAAWDAVVTWHETGALTGGGLTGAYESWEDLRSLDETSVFTLGPTSGSQGWDGKRSWTTDVTKEVRIETSDEAISQTVQDAYRSGYAFFFAQRFASTREYVGTKAADGIEYPVVKITPQGAEPFEVWFDPKTHLITREVQLTGAQPHSFLLADYARLDGPQVGALTVPRKIIDRVGGDPKFDLVTTTKNISLAGPEPTSRYEPPPPPVNSAQWPAGKDSVEIPFRLLNNHIYVDASIDGKPPLPFLFDTGATDLLDAGAAKKLGIPMEGALPGGGFGDKIEAFGFAKVKSVSLGGLTLPDQVFGALDLEALAAVEDVDAGGILGYEYVKRAVLTIDYAQRRMTFTKAAAFKPPQGAVAVPFTFDGHIPIVTGTIDGANGEFEIDTGSRGPLTLMAPFAARHDLIALYHATHRATVGFGVGDHHRLPHWLGDVLGTFGIAGTFGVDLFFVISGFVIFESAVRIDAPVAELTTDTGGGAQEPRMAGNIGGDLLKRFTVTLDYAHQTLWLEANALAAQPEVFDRSGLWIARAKDGEIAVADVAADSAATASGIASGDEILGVNGRSVKSVRLYDLREELKGPVGTRFDLRVKAPNGPERTVVLVLKEQI